MKWTHKKPEDIGWYWYRSEPEIAPSLVFVCWRYAPNEEPKWCAILPCKCDEWFDVNKIVGGDWAGPIPEPEGEEL